MNPNFRQLSLLSIFSLTLIGLAGCGEKHVQVSTVSGVPDEEIALESINEISATKSETEFSDIDSPLAEGQDFSAQSSSSPGDTSNPSLSLANPTGLQDVYPGEELEPIQDTFQIAKAEPTDSLQERLEQIKHEELAAAVAGLEDVFFQFDSWTLTPEGKQSLKHTLGWFEQTPSSNLIIEGHADQRGTQAYNMVLAKNEPWPYKSISHN